VDRAAQVAISAVRDVLLAGGAPVTLVRWVLWSENDFAAYQRAIEKLSPATQA
jgi:hypothetical protein